MQLRYIINCELKVATKVKNTNGTFTNSYTKIGDYDVQKQEINDEISATVYGANIIKMLRLKSINKELENYLIPKVNNENDNISKYFIFINNVCYKINSVNEFRIDIERY